MRPLDTNEGMQKSWTDGRPTKKVVAELIKPSDRLTSFERLEIYNRQYWFRLFDSFREDFPGLRMVLGERKFKKLAQEYLVRYPSRSFTLRNLGRSLEEFLRKEPHWTNPHQKLALDVARFEWAQIVAFDSETRPVLSAEDFLDQDPSRLRLNLQPYLSLLELDYPVDDFLISLKKQALRSETSNASQSHRGTLRNKKRTLPKLKKTFVAVHRMENTLYYKNLEHEAYRILIALQNGETLKKACTTALESNTSAPKNWESLIKQWFQTWTALGWFCK